MSTMLVIRSRQVGSLLAALFFVAATFILLREHNGPRPVPPPNQPQGISKPPPDVQVSDHFISEQTHPVEELIANAQKEQQRILANQSTTLEEAVAAYEQRYKLHPPPHFDEWFKFAKANKVKFIDEYDTIHQLILPFWSLAPVTIRNRAREALGFHNFLMRLSIRSGKVAGIDGADEWQMDATKGMIKKFVKYLPDMDLAFNVQDEPRVVIPHDDLQRLVDNAAEKAQPAAFGNANPRNTWSPAPNDLGDGRSVPGVQTTRFNVFAHQPTWTHSRQSCPPDSSARSLDENTKDNVNAFIKSEIGFVANKTAFSDICNSPSFRSSFGFFERPNAFNIVHDLFPIFSQSKVSSFQDLIYPSPWYWAGKVGYAAWQDYWWEKKENRLYWRGSTTGGYARDGGWQRQHRQHVVKNMNGKDTTVILDNVTVETVQKWRARTTPKADLQALFDVQFSHVGQCDQPDCDAMRADFTIAPHASREEAWRFKYVLDMDGNAFSGRFYAFLRSRSLVFKMAVFREWHDEWIRPWAHYIPLSLRGNDHFEAVRYLDQEPAGRRQALDIASASREWANSVLRNEDLEAWMFRLLLEYGRVVDDNRDKIGFPTPPAP